MGLTSIEWTDRTWSPLRAQVKADAGKIAAEKGYTSLIQVATKMAGGIGPHCEHVSDGCKLCYSGTNNHRCLPSNGTGLPFDRRSRDLIDPVVDEKILLQPVRWQKPQRIFVENQSDLFGEWHSDEAIDRVFRIMALCPWHTFQVLTKRPDRMAKYLYRRESSGAFAPGPLSNVWLGVSVENQETADARIPLLLQTPAAKRFVSYEPALGPVDFMRIPRPDDAYFRERGEVGAIGPKSEPDDYVYWQKRLLHWVIIGGESGPGARPMNPEWVRSTRDQCVEAGVAFFFKQWGEWVSVSEVAGTGKHHTFPDGRTVRRVGKKKAGASIDGREWREFPEVRS